MGDHNAVDIAQEVHLAALRKEGLASPQHLLSYGEPYPNNDIVEGVAIDDHLIAAVIDAKDLYSCT
eukprot:7130728-Karenia_brevis.AAC.1